MQHHKATSQAQNTIILGRPCQQLDQALADLAGQIAGRAEHYGHALLAIDHQGLLASVLQDDGHTPKVIDFNAEQCLNPLERGFFSQPHQAADWMVNSAYRHSTAWGSRLQDTLDSQAVVAWLYNRHADTKPEDQLHPSNIEQIHDTTSKEAAERADDILEVARHHDSINEPIVPNPALATVQMVNSERYMSYNETVAPMRNRLHNLVGSQAYRLTATQPQLDLEKTLEPGRTTVFSIPSDRLGNAATLISNAILQQVLHLADEGPRRTPAHIIVNDISPLCLSWDETLRANRRRNISMHLRTHRLRDFHPPPAAYQLQIDDFISHLEEITSANLDSQDKIHVAQEAAQGCSVIRK